jgi:hypothetical protein
MRRNVACEKENVMAFKTGERFKCPDPNCGCEIEVTKGASESCNGEQSPRCCCGRDMVKQ